MMSDIEEFGIITTINTSDKNMKEKSYLASSAETEIVVSNQPSRPFVDSSVSTIMN